MSMKRVFSLLVALMASGVTVAAAASGPQIRSTRSDATVTNQQDVAQGRARVNVLDSRKNAVLGLTTRDFAVDRDGTAGRIVSVEPGEQSRDVPRHVVLVVDNSYSMVERGITGRELDEVRAVLKTLRPIDDVQMVLYQDGKTVKMGDRPLHVQVAKSNRAAELDGIATAACQKKPSTDNTYLNEAMVAGLEILRGMPADGPRFLWVFSDGEELNSAFKNDVVSQTAQSVPNVRVLAVDCMPGPKMDDFFAKIATQTNGQARKAGSTADLVALFQKAGSTTDHYYVVSYDFPAPSEPAVASAPAVSSAKPMVFQGSTLFDFDKSDLKPEGKEQLKGYREKVRAEMSSASKVMITGYTDSVGTEEYNKKLSLRRAETVRAYLVSLGVDPAKLNVAGMGEANPVADNGTAKGRAKNRRVEIEVMGLSK